MHYSAMLSVPSAITIGLHPAADALPPLMKNVPPDLIAVVMKYAIAAVLWLNSKKQRKQHWRTCRHIVTRLCEILTCGLCRTPS